MPRLARKHQPVEVRFNVVHPHALLPQFGTNKSAAFDIASVEEIRLFSGEGKKVRTGLIIQAPADHMLMIAPRSSTWKKWGVHVHLGIVDEDYCGPDDELHLFVRRESVDSNFPRQIPAGTRLAQGMFVPITRAVFELVDGPLVKESRGGWGSTGTTEFVRHAEGV